MSDFPMETTNILRTFELLMQALAARANTREYCAAKQQMNQAEKYALKRLQQSRNLAKHQTNKAKGARKRGRAPTELSTCDLVLTTVRTTRSAVLKGASWEQASGLCRPAPRQVRALGSSRTLQWGAQ